MALRHDKVRGSLLGLFIGDALAMPAHWYYNQNDIFADFRGWIKDFEPASLQHPTSIMSVSSTGGHGRGDQSGDIIGSVILHGKKEFWGKPRVHYHHGMARGENTLNAQVARVLLRSVASRQQYSPEGFLDDYVSFMTTPGTHNDTYVSFKH